MEFWREALRTVLREQAEPVGVFDANGKKKRNVSAEYAAKHYATDEFVGVGNRRRIRFIKPVTLVHKPAITRAELIRIMNDDPRGPVVHRNRQGRGAKRWVGQPARARTGAAGKARVVFLRPCTNTKFEEVA